MMEKDEIATACKVVSGIYSNDVNESELIFECEFAKYFFTNVKYSPTSMYDQLITAEMQESFPNIVILQGSHLYKLEPQASGILCKLLVVRQTTS